MSVKAGLIGIKPTALSETLPLVVVYRSMLHCDINMAWNMVCRWELRQSWKGEPDTTRKKRYEREII